MYSIIILPFTTSLPNRLDHCASKMHSSPFVVLKRNIYISVSLFVSRVTTAPSAVRWACTEPTVPLLAPAKTRSPVRMWTAPAFAEKVWLRSVLIQFKHCAADEYIIWTGSPLEELPSIWVSSSPSRNRNWFCTLKLWFMSTKLNLCCCLLVYFTTTYTSHMTSLFYHSKLSL